MIVSGRNIAVLLVSLACFSTEVAGESLAREVTKPRVRGARGETGVVGENREETQYRRRGKKSGGISGGFTPGGVTPPGVQTESGNPFAGRTSYACFDYFGWSDKIGNNCFSFFSQPCSNAVLDDSMTPPSEACCSCGGGNKSGDSSPAGVGAGGAGTGDGGEGTGAGGSMGGCPGDDGSCLGNGMVCNPGSEGCDTCCTACCSGKHYMLSPDQGTAMDAVCVVNTDGMVDTAGTP